MQFDKIAEASHYYELGRYEQALTLITDMLSDNLNDGFLLYLAAECYYNTDNYSDAEQHAIESLNSGYPSEKTNYLLGRIYMDLDQFADAEKCFLEALHLNSSNASALSAYGMLMLRTGHEKKAVQLIKDSMRVDPESSVVLHYKLMYVLYRNKNTKELKIWSDFYTARQMKYPSWFTWGFIICTKKNYKEARENFRQAFLIAPTGQ